MTLINPRVLSSVQSALPVQLFICFCFCVSGVLGTFAQLLSFICLWPFSKRIYRQVNYHLATLIWSRT